MNTYSIIGMILILIGTALTYWGSHKDAIKSSKAVSEITERLIASDSLIEIKEKRIFELEETDKINVTPYIERRKYRIIKACLDIRQSIYFASFYPTNHPSPYPEEGFPLDEDLMNMLKKIPKNSLAPARLLPDNGKSWPVFFRDNMEETKLAIKDIHDKSTIVDSRLIKVIAEIEDCEFFSFIPKMLEMERREIIDLKRGIEYQHKPNDITIYHKSLINYFALIKDFEEEFIEFSTTPNARKYPTE